MKIHQIRNATMLVRIGRRCILFDPMLGPPGAIPGFKVSGGRRRRNPLVPLPADSWKLLEDATDVVITHEHPDHFDQTALDWLREHPRPVWASAIDAPSLRGKGLAVDELRDGALDSTVGLIAARHGRGLVGWLMGPVTGVYLAHPGEPSLYVTSDAVLTPDLLAAVEHLQPAVVVAPAGAANAGVGGDILFSVDELVELIRKAPGEVVLNHLEALDHCPTTRAALRQRLELEGLERRVRVPDDGETLELARPPGPQPDYTPVRMGRRSSFQKRVAAMFAGTR